MSSSCKLGDDGTCGSCKKTVGNLFITCFLCKSKFHAANCAVPTSICTSSFHQLYAPLSEKSGVNVSRPGTFLFGCDDCMTNFELNQVQTDNDKIQKLQTQVNNLESGVESIISMLSKKSDTSDTNDKLLMSSNQMNAVGVTTNSNSAWSKSEPVNITTCNSTEYPLLDSIGESSDSHKMQKNKKASILVIDKSENACMEKENMNKIEELVTLHKIDIRNSYKNKVGKTVIICKTDEQRDDLKSKIESKIPSLPMKSVGNLNRTIVVAGFNKHHDENIILNSLLEHNSYISDFIELKSPGVYQSKIDNHISVVAVKPLKRDPDLSQVILRVSSELRDLILKNGDKLRVGMRRCQVYNRFFVKRCYGCQHYGHFHAQCPTPNIVCCSTCAGDHETKDCSASQSEKKCVNCMREGKTERIDHCASSMHCPVFTKATDKLKNSIFAKN